MVENDVEARVRDLERRLSAVEARHETRSQSNDDQENSIKAMMHSSLVRGLASRAVLRLVMLLAAVVVLQICLYHFYGV